MATGTDLEFPPGLPIPADLPTESAERRVLSPEGMLFDMRVGQTDRKAFEDYRFPPYSPAQAFDLDYFWRVTLNRGAKWFATSTGRHWPRPEGRTAIARKFLAPPSWEYIHTGKAEGGYWQVSGTFEVRGTGQLPIEPDPPSAWNPLDIITGQTLPPVVVLTEDNRVATRDTIGITQYEAGVRGFKSNGGIVGQKFYLEIEIISIGAPGDTQNLEVGLIDDTVDNILSRPPPSPDSEITNTGGNYLIAYSRTVDGPIYASEPAPPTNVGDFGSGPQPGDVYGFAWIVGTSITVTRNGGGGVVVPFLYSGQLFPYFSAGATLVNATSPTGTGESARIRTGKRHFATALPLGYYAWG